MIGKNGMASETRPQVPQGRHIGIKNENKIPKIFPEKNLIHKLTQNQTDMTRLFNLVLFISFPCLLWSQTIDEIKQDAKDSIE